MQRIRGRVEHSGGGWDQVGIGSHGRSIWPIEEYIARTDHTPEEIAELKRLNPNGKEEGEMPIGKDILNGV